jgi:NAD(P)-dependent dehydrogenase (short-subunit alcohol dehydrogenase family)
MDLELSGKVVLLTGALGGFGRALIRRFQAEGADVVAAGRETAAAAAPILAGAFAHPPRYIRLDYSDAATISTVVAAAAPNIVVANAGLTHSHKVSEVPLAEWEKVVAVNLTGNLLLGQAAGRHLVAKGGGVILFVGSWVQSVPKPNVGAYGPSKAAMKMMALCLAKEFAPHGVRVNVISPGIIDSGMAARQMAAEPARREHASRVTLCGRLGTAEEIADACAFLCSPRASFIIGADLVIDGGASLGAS